MQNPAWLQSFASALPLVAAGAQAVNTPLAAPGAGLRYRVWGWTGYHTIVTEAPLRDQWGLTSSGVVLTAGSTSGFDSITVMIPGGLIWGVNLPVVAFAFGDLLNVHRSTVVFYTIESQV